MTTTTPDASSGAADDNPPPSPLAEAMALAAAAGLTPAQLALLAGQAAQPDRTVGTLLPPALDLLRRDMPGSHGTWAGYLTAFADGMPDVCPCPCPTCAVGPCPCGPTGSRHDTTCTPPKDLPYPCSSRYAGVAHVEAALITATQVKDLAWWAERRALKGTVVKNLKRADKGLPKHTSDGRGAAESAIQGLRWLFDYFIVEKQTTGVTDNPAKAKTVKLPRRQEQPARSLTDEETLEVYRVGVTTGRDPELDGLLLRHQLIHAVRRGGLLELEAGGLVPDKVELIYFDRKRKTNRTRPSTTPHLQAMIAHIIDRGARIAAPADAPEELRRSGIPTIRDEDPAFYRKPIDNFDEDGYFVSRVTRPVTRKHIETLFTRIKHHLPWAQRRGLRPHDMRHTSARMVYRAAGHDQQMAALHLAHDSGSTTEHYLKEQLEALARLKEELFSPDGLAESGDNEDPDGRD